MNSGRRVAEFDGAGVPTAQTIPKERRDITSPQLVPSAGVRPFRFGALFVVGLAGAQTTISRDDSILSGAVTANQGWEHSDEVQVDCFIGGSK